MKTCSLALFLPASMAETFLMLGSTMFVLVAELLNSGVEAAIDRISLEHHRLSKRAKDYGSAAVMIAIIFCAITHAFFCGGGWVGKASSFGQSIEITDSTRMF